MSAPPGGWRPSWLASLRARLFARRTLKHLLRSYEAVRARRPDLSGNALYGEVLVESGAVSADDIGRWLRDAEDSMDEWTAPGRDELRLREVAHFLVVWRYRKQGHVGAAVSFAAIVDAMIPAHL